MVKETIKTSGFAVLFIGAAVLLFTFYNAYLFLSGAVDMFSDVTGNLMEAFGETLAPLIETCIRAIYLGIMGWIGSILTRRGVQIVTIEGEASKPKESGKTAEGESEAGEDLGQF